MPGLNINSGKVFGGEKSCRAYLEYSAIRSTFDMVTFDSTSWLFKPLPKKPVYSHTYRVYMYTCVCADDLIEGINYARSPLAFPKGGVFWFPWL